MKNSIPIFIVIALAFAAGAFILLRPTTTSTPASSATYTLTDVSTHATSSNCWMAIDGQVYDVTSYIPDHPNQQIVDGCGKDATSMFKQIRQHNGRATSMLSRYHIGALSQ